MNDGKNGRMKDGMNNGATDVKGGRMGGSARDSFAFSRRHFFTVAAAGLALSQTLEAKKMINSRMHGVYVGIQTYSLRGLRWDAVIPAMKQVGIGEAEIFSTQVEPLAADVPDLAKWRASDAAITYFTDVRKKFNDAGIAIYGYNGRFGTFAGGRGRGGARGAGGPGAGAAGAGAPAAAPPAAPATPPPAPPPVTDAEIERQFEIAKALGAKTFNGGVQPAIADRVGKVAERYKMVVGITAQTPETLALSPYFKYDIDIGNYTAAGHDALQFVTDNYDKITDIHLKDCKLNGPSVPFGTGDSHMKEILQLMKKRKSQIRANIDCDYPGTGTSVEEVQKCFDYVKQCLA
jgi:hypothetical protein